MNRQNLIHKITVKDNSQICQDHYKLTLVDDGSLSGETAPGQFINIAIPRRPDLILRRPFSVARANPAKKQIEIVYRIVGKGTQALIELSPGAVLNVMGPLGRGWSLPENSEKCLLIGGGCGIAPLWGLAEQLMSRKSPFHALIGFQTADKVFGESVFQCAGGEITVTTDDGTYGEKGFVVDHLSPILDKGIDRVYICGPTLMAKSVIPNITEKNIWGEISLEENMGCGFGVCLSCVTDTKKDGLIQKERICTEGPVFSIQEIVWEP